jgi:antirestriction protein ArdC
MQVLKEDSKAFSTAASRAQAVADYLLVVKTRSLMAA